VGKDKRLIRVFLGRDANGNRNHAIAQHNKVQALRSDWAEKLRAEIAKIY